MRNLLRDQWIHIKKSYWVRSWMILCRITAGRCRKMSWRQQTLMQFTASWRIWIICMRVWTLLPLSVRIIKVTTTEERVLYQLRSLKKCIPRHMGEANMHRKERWKLPIITIIIKGTDIHWVCIIHYMIPEKYLMQEGFCAWISMIRQYKGCWL